MSRSRQDFFDSRRMSGKAPERSSFAQTCNRLSQYVKERGSLRDLGLDIAGKLESKGRSEATSHFTATTRNLFPNMEKPGEVSAHQGGLMDLFPQHAGDGSPSTQLETEPKTAQMTIFYGGQVLVFDNFPADKAVELMLVAGGESCPNPSGFLSTPGPENVKSSTDSVASGSERLQPQPRAIVSDLPIARRASLHRFLEKRKDRVTATAPYQVHGGASTSSSKHEEQLALKL